MKDLFNKINHRNLAVIEVSNLSNVDELCSTILLKIYLSLKYNYNVKITSKYLLGSDIFHFDSYEKKKNDAIFKIDPLDRKITMSVFNNNYEEKINSLTISDYLYTLLFINDYIIDKDIISFYTILSLKCTISDNKYNEIRIKLRNIIEEKDLKILEENIKIVIENLSKYMI